MSNPIAKNVTPQYIDAPKPGKTMWSMKDTEGTKYSVEPPDAAKLQIGVPVQVEYEAKVFESNGRSFPWNKVLTVQAAGPVQVAAAMPQAQAAPQTAPASGQVVPNHVSNWVGQAIAHGTIQQPSEIAAWAAAAYCAVGLVPPVMPPKPQQQAPDMGDLDDSIPF